MSELQVSISKRESDDDHLADRIRESCDDRREGAELIARDEDTDRSYLIEEPSSDIWLAVT